MADINELYKQYGELMIQLEIVQAKIQAVKQQIVNELNRPKEQKKEVESSDPT